MPTIEDVKKFFIGDRKFVKSTKDTPVYLEPGQAPYKTVEANEVIGKVEGVNSKGNWLKLRTDSNYNPSGGWVLVSDNMYIVQLNTEAPTGITNALGREAKEVINNVSGFVWSNVPTWLKIVLILIIVLLIIAVFIRISGTTSLPSFA